MKEITIVAGARPNFVKIAPLIKSIRLAQEEGKNIKYRLVHTGQHYDARMSQVFFEELNIPAPDVNLMCGGGTQAEQTASIMVSFEKELLRNPTDLIMVVGDVTSTMACSIVAKKMNCKLAHVEAGIRSWDMTMPEEINRIVTDSLADYFFTTTRLANKNLKNMGVSEERIFFVGNVMIDTLLTNYKRFSKPDVWANIGLKEKEYFIVTLHRPGNVDEIEKLKKNIAEIVFHTRGLPVVFPMHPRTKAIFKEIDQNSENLFIIAPLSYLKFNYLVKNAKAVITDSGGITEETTVLGVPCITLRDNTERPETVEVGTNEIVGTNPEKIGKYLRKVFEKEWKHGTSPELWDGKSSERIVKKVIEIL